MGVIVTPQTEIDKYFESDALSQSSLKKLLGGFDNFLSDQSSEKELYYEEKSYFIVGSAVDTILTGEKGEFEKQFYVSQLEKKPSDVEMSIINQVFDELADNGVAQDTILEDCYDMILLAIDEHGWQKNWKTETRVKKIVEKGTDYFEDLKRAYGKQIITSEQKTLIDNIVMSLTTHPRTSKYFDRDQQDRIAHMDFYYQLPIYFEYKDIDCKALMDLVVIAKDESGKIISIQPFDLKTMSGNTLQFISKMKYHRYDIQAAWYNLAIRSWVVNNLSIKDKKQDLMPLICLLIKPFTFIVESTTMPGKPLVYEIDDELLLIGTKGRPAVKLIDTNFHSDNKEMDVTIIREIKGYEQLMEEYLYYEATDWKEDKMLEKSNNGVLKLSWDGII